MIGRGVLFALALSACAPADFGGPGALPPTAPAPTIPSVPAERDGIPIVVTADEGEGKDAVVSLGVPFAPGALQDAATIALFDAQRTPVARDVQVLARWPRDGSIRSALVAFKTTLGPAQSAVFRLKVAGGGALVHLGAAPDGPFTAILPASYYAEAAATGPLLPAASDTRFPRYEEQIEQGLVAMRPPYEAHGSDCEHTTNHRTYYDGPHAFFQRFARAPRPDTYRRARAEAALYRARELRFEDGRGMAVHACEPRGWTPQKKLDWSTLRRMLGQGMLDDWLLTGDPAAREAVVAMGEALRRDLPALVGGRENTLRVTERNMAWTLMGLAAYYAVDPRPEVKQAMAGVVDDAIAWQARGASGAFEHDIARPDPEECERGPRGASPFMTSLLVDALMDVWTLTGDLRIADVVRKVAEWYARDAVTSDGRAFRYLWGCEGDPNDDSGVADLNLLIVHVFGAAFALTGDRKWLIFGDKMADSGVAAMQTVNPKQWNQAARSFPRYLGYRAKGLPP